MTWPNHWLRWMLVDIFAQAGLGTEIIPTTFLILIFFLVVLGIK
jgi:hypothetical protein